MAEMEGVLAWWLCSIKRLQHWSFKCKKEANEREKKGGSTGCNCFSSPHNTRFTRVVEESALIYEFAELGFQDTVEFVCLTASYILMVVKVNHLHCICVL